MYAWITPFDQDGALVLLAAKRFSAAWGFREGDPGGLPRQPTLNHRERGD